MISHRLVEISPYLAGLLTAWQIFRAILFVWRKTKKEVGPITPKSRTESARFFTVLVSVLTITFGLVVLLAVGLQATSSLSPALVVLAGAVAGLGLLGALVMAFGLPAYNYVKDVEARCQRLEERLRTTELDVQPMKRFLEETFPTQQKLAFMDSMVHAETQDEYTS